MPTALAAQLAAIAAQSTNDLDLKAQRKSHSQSLIFEPSEAARQDFDTIYDICIDGYRELCQLEGRFLSFKKNIFSPHSKTQERTQLTRAQDGELNKVLERFLRLVGSKVQLQPAIRAIEWLIRRFSVHEHNTLCLVLTFLPYHTLPVFTTLMSILPKKLLPAIKFLHPYIESLKTPPRDVIVYSAINNTLFFIGWNKFIIQGGEENFLSQSAVSYWATVMTEALAGQLDRSISSRQDTQEHVIHQILPVLRQGLAMKAVPDLRVGCYMIVLVLASRVSFREEALNEFMEAVVQDGTRETSHEELICVATLAQRRSSHELPYTVFQRLLSIDTLADDLLRISEHCQVSNLMFSMLNMILQRSPDGLPPNHEQLIQASVRQNILSEVQTFSLAKTALGMIQQNGSSQSNGEVALASSLAVLYCLSESRSARPIMQKAIANLEPEQLEALLAIAPYLKYGDDGRTEQTAMEITEDSKEEELTYSAIKARMPSSSMCSVSVLSGRNSGLFQTLANAFSFASENKADTQDFLASPVFHSSGSDPTLLVSFLARYWCSRYPAHGRALAVQCFNEVNDNKMDYQAILPYLLCALSDDDLTMRRAAEGLVLALANTYRGSSDDMDMKICSREDLYNQDSTSRLSWLSTGEVALLFDRVLVPNLEEVVMDGSHLFRILQQALGTSQKINPDGGKKIFKSSSKASFLKFLATHATATPLLSVRSRVLRALYSLSKSNGISKNSTFLPLLSQHMNQTELQFSQDCQKEGLLPEQYSIELVQIVDPSSDKGNDVLQHILGLRETLPVQHLMSAASRHVIDIWDAMSLEMKASWADKMFEAGINNANENASRVVIEIARELLAKVTLSAESLIKFLEETFGSSNAQDQHSPSPKRRKVSEDQVEHINHVDIKELSGIVGKATAVLEIIEVSKNGTNAALLPCIFRVLQQLQGYSSQMRTDIDYVISAALSSITRIINTSQAPNTPFINQQSVKVDMIVNCFGESKNPQVQHECLLLLSSLAALAPELIVHRVMPIFTFMKDSVLQRTDQRSARVVRGTIDSIIPPLATSFRKRKSGMLRGASELISIFVAAFEHIPTDRRVELLTAVLEKLGCDDCLHVLLIILRDKYGAKPAVVDFCEQIVAQYHPIVQLKSIQHCVELATDSLESVPRKLRQILPSEKEKYREATSKMLISLPCDLLKAPRFSKRISKMLTEADGRSSEIRQLYSNLVEQVLQLNRSTRASIQLIKANETLLKSLLNFLPLGEALRSLYVLLENGSDETCVQVLRTFEKQIAIAKQGDTSSEEACFAVLPRLTVLLRTSQDAVLRRTVVACIDHIAERYGKRDPNAMIEAAQVVSSGRCLGNEEHQMQTMALLCLITLVEVLREAAIPLTPNMLPMALQTLERSLQHQQQDSRSQAAVFSLFSSLFLYIPWMVSGQHLHRVMALSYECSNKQLDATAEEARVDMLDLLAKRTSTHECINALIKLWDIASSRGSKAILEHMEILRKVIEKAPKSQIITEAHLLTTLFLETMSLPRFQSTDPDAVGLNVDEMKKVDKARNENMIKMIYKLNDKYFRPLFTRMLDQSAFPRKNEVELDMSRQISLFSFLHHFFDTLQSIVTGYAIHLIEQVAQLLGDMDGFPLRQPALWDKVVRTLYAMFEHDQEEFWRSPSRFSSICAPLVAQLKHASTQDVQVALIPCITSFAAATDSPDHLKSINQGILEHLRSDDAKARLAAVRCEMSLTDRLGEEWLNLLPEMLPAISEAMEDDDENVEREIRTWAKKIENVLGENLDDMLQ